MRLAPVATSLLMVIVRFAMTKSLYKPSNIYLGQYRCVALDSNDYMLVGTKGWIFKTHGDRVGCVLIDRYGNEKLTYWNLSELKRLVDKINVLRDMEQACRYANNPNLRHDNLSD